jgi:hypothetical protein
MVTKCDEEINTERRCFPFSTLCFPLIALHAYMPCSNTDLGDVQFMLIRNFLSLSLVFPLANIVLMRCDANVDTDFSHLERVSTSQIIHGHDAARKFNRLESKMLTFQF